MYTYKRLKFHISLLFSFFITQTIKRQYTNKNKPTEPKVTDKATTYIALDLLHAKTLEFGV